jgi:transketolase C-terminal domain/subunit
MRSTAGVGDAVLAALANEGMKSHELAVREIARSGKSTELLKRFGIDANGIVKICRQAIGR